MAFEIAIEAPTEIRDVLLRHSELVKYQNLRDLEDSELARLTDAAVVNMQELLGTLGYFSPMVSLTTTAMPQNPLVQHRITVKIEAGARARIDTVTLEFTGAIASDDAMREQRRSIRAGWSLRKGDNFTQSAWDAAKTDALRLLTATNFPTGRIAASLADIDPQTGLAHLSLTFDSGPVYRIGPVQVTGNRKFDPLIVARLARLTPGTPYDQSQLVAAQQRLSDSGLFDSAFVSLDTTAEPANAPVLIQLREARLQKIVLGVGGSTDSGLRLSMEHTHHQVPGIDWQAVTRLALDRSTKALGTEFTSPPDDSGTRWVTSVLLQRQTSGSFEVLSQRYRLGRTQTGQRIDRNYFLQYDRAEDSAGNFSSTANALTANYAWTQRNFDSLPFPSAGYGLGAELGGGTTLGDSSQPFLRAQVRWLGLWTPGSVRPGSRSIARNGRISLRAEGGMVLARDGVELPSTQLFLTGGDTSVRGYVYRGIGSERADGTTAAGRYLAVGSVEWQRPIVVNDRVTAWESTVFVDAGAVADTMEAMHAKIGLGVGARWRSPVGPLQMDLAYGLATKAWRLHLNVGFTF